MGGGLLGAGSNESLMHADCRIVNEYVWRFFAQRHGARPAVTAPVFEDGSGVCQVAIVGDVYPSSGRPATPGISDGVDQMACSGSDEIQRARR